MLTKNKRSRVLSKLLLSKKLFCENNFTPRKKYRTQPPISFYFYLLNDFEPNNFKLEI